MLPREPRRREFSSLVATLLPRKTRGNLLQTQKLFQLAIAICVKNNLSNTEYEIVFGTRGYINQKWGGSCYGMAVLNVLAKDGIIPYTTYKSGASNLFSLNKPVNDDKINSLITYYHMLQMKDDIQQLKIQYNKKSNKQIINELISLLDNNTEVLVGFFTNTWGHAIVATGYEYGSWTYNGITYQGCIKICDPNSSTAYNKDNNIYFNSTTYNWAIPKYYWDGGSSTRGARFGFISADTFVLNSGGYYNSSFGNTTTFDNSYESFVARIDAYSISDNRHVSKVRYESEQYTTNYSSLGDIEEDNSYVFAGESGAVAGYNLYDAQSAYQITQDEHVEMQLSINYGNCYLLGGSLAGESVLFDKNGFIQVKGESTDYNVSMTFNDYYPTDWFTVEVRGSNANTTSLKKADNGYIISSDTFDDVQVKCNNRSVVATATFSTNYKSVLIYEIDENTIGLKVDADGNGTYETELPVTQNTNQINEIKLYGTQNTNPIGDVTGDGFVNVRDITAIQRYLAELVTLSNDQLASADVNGDDIVDINDVTHLKRYLAEFDDVILGKQNQ